MCHDKSKAALGSPKTRAKVGMDDLKRGPWQEGLAVTADYSADVELSESGQHTSQHSDCCQRRRLEYALSI